MLGTNVGRALLVGAGALSVVAAFVPFARKPPATPHGPPPPPLAAPARPVAPPEAPAASPAAAPAASPPAAAPPASDGVAAALALAEAGKRDEAIARLEGLRRAQPKNADAAAELARLKFEKRRWSEGIAAFRAAVKEDPARRQDPVLVGHVIRALGSDKAGDRADELLRELGPPARPFLREAAKRDPSPKVRDRCREILADGGKKKKPFLRWFR
jgi:serine/threonine-protein kinase